MKPHVADFATRFYCVRIVPANDAPVLRLAGYPTDITMSNGQVYKTEFGYEFSGLGNSSTFASATVDLNGILQLGAVSRDDLMSGVYDNARVYLFATSWMAPVEDEEPLACLFFGKTTITDDGFKTELMGMIDALSQSTGRSYAPTCQWTFLDKTLDGEMLSQSASRCIGPRSAPDGPSFASLKVTGTLTAVTDQYQFADSARTEASDYFGAGAIRFISGPNAGLKPMEVKSFASGVITVHEAFFYMPQVGDQYEMIPGCRKRHIEDCKNKWNNVRNFGGQPHVPTPSVYTQVGRN
ncbi:DUF2163 domain-containing protein [Pseudomonas sp. zfem003]|uniref:DUF2163 domain-containing protein n=1 Tax=Pseudomonas sp. zfem003 TaxID=3078198 RepID=UPI002928348F|nr:DUF2163 domain-containing protein [Pseudomonas sp. zfem003]MDU9398024.1 DUF2163 domain-containing protein [Pseudomonas sp. zfem003]